MRELKTCRLLRNTPYKSFIRAIKHEQTSTTIVPLNIMTHNDVFMMPI